MKISTVVIPQAEGPEKPPKLDRDLHFEDGRQAAILEILFPESETLWLKLISWDEAKKHPEMMALLDGRPLRITIEHVEEGEEHG